MTLRRPAEFATWPTELPYTFGPYRAVVAFHVDGDTFDALVDVGWNDYKYKPVRLLGVDTPETNRAATKAAGLAAKAYVQQLIPVGSPVLLHTIPDPDSFGRYLARVQLRDGRDLTDLILAAGHGVPA